MTIKWNDTNIRLTVSGGLSSFPEEADSVLSLLQTADEAVPRTNNMCKTDPYKPFQRFESQQ
ncbi:MAG: hypothetical protein QNK29_12645 [Desulfobacterales bacterium]|nr:hypothetical protein [Desulfobacterales bacterium]MDX2512791.1 hypothetical protein [Desulfobacterales bacterium]